MPDVLAILADLAGPAFAGPSAIPDDLEWRPAALYFAALKGDRELCLSLIGDLSDLELIFDTWNDHEDRYRDWSLPAWDLFAFQFNWLTALLHTRDEELLTSFLDLGHRFSENFLRHSVRAIHALSPKRIAEPGWEHGFENPVALKFLRYYYGEKVDWGWLTLYSTRREEPLVRLIPYMLQLGGGSHRDRYGDGLLNFSLTERWERSYEAARCYLMLHGCSATDPCEGRSFYLESAASSGFIEEFELLDTRGIEVDWDFPRQLDDTALSHALWTIHHSSSSKDFPDPEELTTRCVAIVRLLLRKGCSLAYVSEGFMNARVVKYLPELRAQ